LSGCIESSHKKNEDAQARAKTGWHCKETTGKEPGGNLGFYPERGEKEVKGHGSPKNSGSGACAQKPKREESRKECGTHCPESSKKGVSNERMDPVVGIEKKGSFQSVEGVKSF